MVGQEAGDFFPCWFRKNSAWVGTQNVFIDSLSQFLKLWTKKQTFQPKPKRRESWQIFKQYKHGFFKMASWVFFVFCFLSNYKVPQEQHIIILRINRQEKDKIGAIKAKQIKQIIALDIIHSLSFLDESPIFCASLFGQFIQSSEVQGSIREKNVSWLPRICQEKTKKE